MLTNVVSSDCSNGNAGLRWLDRREPDLEEARVRRSGALLTKGHRAAQIITSIRAMFQKGFGREIAGGDK